jgi:hypothetical protein
MRLIFSLIVVMLTGCAIPPPKPMTFFNQPSTVNTNTGISVEQLERIQLSNADCKNIDQRIGFFEKQLELHGTWGRNPEDMSEEDRRYNSAGKVAIWSLRIGCNNPNRYQQ